MLDLKNKVRRAERKNKKLRLAVSGQAGAGKTYAALQLAETIVGKDSRILVFDTEFGRASLYADQYEFDSWVFDPAEMGRLISYKDYIDIINYGVEEKYDIIILDSVTPEWKDITRIVNGMKGNGLQNWGRVKDRQHGDFLNAILFSNIHIICTIRSKEKTAMVDGKVQSKGVGEEQDSDLKFFLDFVFTIQDRSTHSGILEKSPPGLSDKYDGIETTLSKALMTDITSWLQTGLPNDTFDFIVRIKQLYSTFQSLKSMPHPNLLTDEQLAEKTKEELTALGKALAKEIETIKNDEIK